MSLDKALKEKDELGIQIPSSTCALKEILISYLRTEIAKNQTQDLNQPPAELQYKLNFQPCRVSTVSVRALIGQEWDPELE